MSTQLAPLSACVTRILSVAGFPKELRTKDIQHAFSDWESVQGGFKVKWVDDTSLYIVFQDASVAKRAYLQALYSPSPVFISKASSSSSASSPSTPGSSSKCTGTKIRPYAGADAAQIIQSVNQRNNGHTRGHSSRASISVGGGAAGAHARMGSHATGRNGNGHGNGHSGRHEVIQEITIPSSTSAPQGVASFNRDREPSPTLPNLPQQPTLNALISSSLSPDHLANDPLASGKAAAHHSYAEVAHSGPHPTGPASGGVAPRLGDPGRRIIAHSLGVKHPGLSRSLSGDELSARMKELQRGAEGMAITE